jgi:glycosyltransferase involved in cell wall biosynthesis
VAGHNRVTAVPPGVEPEQLTPRARNPQPGRVLYVGHMEHLPNLMGLMFLYGQVWPHLTKEVPFARLIVAGTGTREELGRLGPRMLARMDRDPAVEIAGFVPDLYALMDTCAVMAAPLDAGSGVRNKVIEAMAAGLPVVTTALGAEGLAVEHERELLIADDAAGSARELVRLLKDEQLQARLSAAGRELVAREHDNERIVKRLERALMRAAGARACRCSPTSRAMCLTSFASVSPRRTSPASASPASCSHPASMRRPKKRSAACFPRPSYSRSIPPLAFGALARAGRTLSAFR